MICIHDLFVTIYGKRVVRDLRYVLVKIQSKTEPVPVKVPFYCRHEWKNIPTIPFHP